MKYIIMCGGNYPKFKTRKQLLKVNGEVLVERTIRLLKENGIKDIAISTNCNEFDYLGLPILMQDNNYINGGEFENKKSECCWLNAYYPMEEPCCYLHGDVYFSDEAIKIIVETKVKDTMFFCVKDIHDGRPTGINAKGREPLAYKVENNKLFNNAVKDILKMVDDGVFENILAPFSWHLYRYINGLEFITNDWGFINNIFNTKGDYVVINDYTTDIDKIEDVEIIEKMFKMMKGGIKMVKVEVIEGFTLRRFNELQNIVRKNPDKDKAGELFIGDTFDCDLEMYKYLTGENAEKRAFVNKIPVEVTPKKKTTRAKKTAKTEETNEENVLQKEEKNDTIKPAKKLSIKSKRK